MMRVIVEIVPGGIETYKRTLASVEIANVSSLAEVSDYDVRAILERGRMILGRVNGHKRSDGWIPLVRRVLEAIGPTAGQGRKS